MTPADLIAGAFLVAFVLAGLALVFFLVWWQNRSLIGGYAPLVEHMRFRHRTNARGKPVPEVLEGSWRTRPARIQFHHGGRGDPGRLSFTLDASLEVHAPVHVYPRRWYHRLATAIGLVRHVAHGRSRFHQEAHLESDDDALAEALARSDAFRESVLPLLRQPRAVVTVESTGVSLTLRRCHSRRRKRALRIRNVESIFNALTGAVASFERGRSAGEPETAGDRTGSAAAASPIPANLGGGRATRALILTSALLLFVGPLTLWWGSRYPSLGWDLHVTGYAVGAAIAAITLVLSFRAVRGRSRALGEFGMFALWAIVGYPTFAAGAAAVVNGLADRGEPQLVPAVVVDVADSPSLRIALEYAEGEPIRKTVRVSRSFYRQARPGTRLDAAVKPGFLGVPWLQRVVEDSRHEPH